MDSRHGALALILVAAAAAAIGAFQRAEVVLPQSHEPPVLDEDSRQYYAAVCLALAGQAHEALRHAEAAVRLERGFLPAYMTLASLRLQANDKKNALRAYDQALALAPWEQIRRSARL
ncbi:MAG: hypothetical protein HY921_01060 [Elusimicrobia bacterium]|nr:hypothetical protein [Elusimicrobiota bacterium]